MSPIGWILLALAVGGGQFESKPSIVRCPSDPPEIRKLQMVELWRVPQSENDGLLMGYVSPLGVARVGDTLLFLDNQLSTVFVFGMDGELQRTVVREGDGPGEIRMPQQLQVLHDGRLAILHGVPCKLTFVEADGEPSGNWQPPGFVATARLLPSPRGWIGAYESIDIQRSTSDTQRRVFRLALHDDQGRVTRSYVERERMLDLRDPKPDEARDYLPWKTWTVSESGDLIIGDERDKYRFRWIGEDGEPFRVVEREFPAYRRTDADLEKVKKSYTPHGSDTAVAVRGAYCTHEPVLKEISTMADGRILIETSLSRRDLPEGVIYRYEIHESTGQLAAQVQIHQAGDYDPRLDDFVLVGDKLVVLRNLLSAFRSAEADGVPADTREQVLPDEREDSYFCVVVYDLVAME